MPKLTGSNSTILVILKHCDFGAKIQNAFYSNIFVNLNIWTNIVILEHCVPKNRV